MIEVYSSVLIKEAKKAFDKGLVPVSALVVKDNKVISKAFNREKATDHAEILAINKALKKLKTKRLDCFDMYVSLEPCPMCLYAISLARIRSLYFFSKDEKNGAIFRFEIYDKLLYKPKWVYIQKDEFSYLLKEFFNKKR